MQAVFDHLIAVIAGGAVLLLIGTMTDQSMNAALDGSLHQRSRAKSVAAASRLAQDLRNVGAGGSTDPIISGTDSSLTVEAPVASGDTASTVQYERNRVGTGPDGNPLYEVVRSVNDSVTGRIPSMRSFHIHCLNAEGDTLSYSNSSFKTETTTFSVRFTLDPDPDRPTSGREWRLTLDPFHLAP